MEITSFRRSVGRRRPIGIVADRELGAMLVLLGALLIWLPYDLVSGIVLVVAGATLELVGIALEKSDKQA